MYNGLCLAVINISLGVLRLTFSIQCLMQISGNFVETGTHAIAIIGNEGVKKSWRSCELILIARFNEFEFVR